MDLEKVAVESCSGGFEADALHVEGGCEAYLRGVEVVNDYEVSPAALQCRVSSDAPSARLCPC